MKRFTIVALAVAIALGVLVSPFASSEPDGLERVATDHGFVEKARSHANYGPLAGLTGTLLVFALGYGIARARR
jgi:hypothetical protein